MRGSEITRPFSPKLDPLLSLVAARAAQEKVAVPARPVERPRAGELGEVVAPSSVRGMAFGVQSLMVQLSSTARAQLFVEDRIPLLVDSVNPDEVKIRVTEWGGASRRLTRSTLLVRAPRSRLGELASLKSVSYVEASTRLEPHCDLAHASAALVVAGIRSVPQTGRGVIVGVVDTGIDVSHPAFASETGGGDTRIVYYLDQTTGREYDRADIIAGRAAASPDEIGHGTHVAAIAAGNGAGSPGGRYQGVAPGADLAAVKTTFDSADIAAAVAQLFEFADRSGKPCVVNLSLGGHFGGHDGTSVVERTIDQLSGRGRVVVVSAGNEWGAHVHASTVLQHGDARPSRWVADLEIRPQVIQGSLLGFMVVQAWHQHEDEITIHLRSPNGDLFEVPEGKQSSFDRDVFYVEATHQRAPYSGDHSTTFQIVTVNDPRWLTGWSLVAEEALDGRGSGIRVGPVHAWILRREMGRFTNGHASSHLVGMPGTAFSAVTVASYATRRQWPSADPARGEVVLDAINVEDISYFSSPGPTREGDNKPEIAAPGQWLLSALSSAASMDEIPLWLRTSNGPYAALQGTSMAAPYVTGALALLLEKEPNVDWAETKRRLIKSAKQDSFTGTCWNPRWGYGKVNVTKLLTIEP